MKKTVSTSGASTRLLWASCISVSKSLIARRPRTIELGADARGRSRRSGRRTRRPRRGRRRAGSPRAPSRMIRDARRRPAAAASCAGWRGRATTTPVEHGAARADDVEVAVGDRVERAGVDRDRLIDPPGAGRRSAPSRRSGARARMLAARPRPAAASRQKCLATTRPPGARSGPSGLERLLRAARVSVVRRVDDDDVERAARGRAAGSRQPGERPRRGRSAARRSAEARSAPRFAAMTAAARRVALDERGVRRAARQRLDAGRAAAREQVEDAGAGAGPARGSRTASA